MSQVTPYNSTESKKAQVEDMFDNIAGKYDFLNRLLSMKIDVLWRNRLVKMMLQDQPQKVLDVATGTGDLAITIQKQTSAQVIGLDLSQKMLDVAQQKIEKLNLKENISLIKGDAEKLPFPDNNFDAVSVAFGVRNFENLNDGLDELKRVVKQNGSVYILEFSKVDGFLGGMYKIYFKNILPRIGKMVSKDHRAYTYLPDSVDAFPSGAIMRSILYDRGFRNVVYTKLTYGIATIYKATK